VPLINYFMTELLPTILGVLAVVLTASILLEMAIVLIGIFYGDEE
jgi:hypothetical protein